MRKEYIYPKVKFAKLNPATLLAGSGEPGTDVDYSVDQGLGDGEEDDLQNPNL